MWCVLKTPPLRAAWQVRRSSARICASKTTANTSAVTSTTASSIGRSRDTTRAARARRKSTSLRVDSCCASCAKALRRSRSKCCAPLMLPSSSLSSTERSKRCSVALVTGTVRIVGLCGGRPSAPTPTPTAREQFGGNRVNRAWRAELNRRLLASPLFARWSSRCSSSASTAGGSQKAFCTHKPPGTHLVTTPGSSWVLSSHHTPRCEGGGLLFSVDYMTYCTDSYRGCNSLGLSSARMRATMRLKRRAYCAGSTAEIPSAEPDHQWQ